MPKEQQNDLKQALGSQLVNQVVAIRQRRRVVEETWLHSRRAWMNSAIDRQFRSTDTSPNDYNIPMGRRSLERTIVRGVKLLTPNVKWFEVSPIGSISDEKTANVDRFMHYVLRKRIKSRTNISQLIRSMIMYGVCYIKTSIEIVNNQVWPCQRVVDPFAFYIFPETVSSITDAEVVFEDFLFSYDRYKGYVEKGIVEDIHYDDLVKPEWPYHLIERLAYQGITDPTQDIDIVMRSAGETLEKTSSGFLSLSELWLKRDSVLYQVYLLWNHKDGPRIVGFIKSEYTEPLYRGAIHRPLPGELYTNSMAEDIAQLTTLSNDQLNKFQDAVDWEQGFVAINGQGRTDTWKMKGRAKWEVEDDPRQAINFIQPPVTSTNHLRALQWYVGLMQSLSGAGTIAEGQPGRNMPRAGGAVNNLINLSMSDIQDISEVVEQEVLTLSLSDIYKVSSMFIPDDQLMLIPGGRGLTSNVLKKENILGDYEFEWVGSLQFQDEQVRAQRMLIFLNMAIQPMANQLLQQQGYAFNFVELVKTVWRYGLGERGLSDVVIPLEKMQQAIQGVQAQQQASQSQNGSNGVPGLSYRLPTVTEGFVQQ